VTDHLSDEGRILLFFGTSGDSEYVATLIRDSGLETEKLTSRTIVKDGLEVEYYVYRLARPDDPGRRTPGAAARSAGTGSASGRATTRSAP
jgi:hypothetical protein